jgi:lipoate-protein ligase A
MTRYWRVVYLPTEYIRKQFATEEAVFQNVLNGGRPTLLIYGCYPSVSIGYGQSLSDLNLVFARDKRIEFSRRRTGGRANYHNHRTDVVWSFIATKDDLGINGSDKTASAKEAYRITSDYLIQALRDSGVKGQFENGLNQVILDGKKIAGSAQFHAKDGVYIHGFLMTHKPDFETTYRVIKTQDPMVHMSRALQSVTCLDNYGVHLNNIIGSFFQILDADEGRLTLGERLARRRILGKYKGNEWQSQGKMQGRGACLTDPPTMGSLGITFEEDSLQKK